MRQIVHYAHAGFPAQGAFDVQFFRCAAPIADPLKRNHLQLVHALQDVAAPPGVNKPDYNIHAALLKFVSVFEHLVGLPDTWCIAEINLEMALSSEISHSDSAF